jgi:hypothetical protein
MIDLTQKVLTDHLHYDDASGRLYWKKRKPGGPFCRDSHVNSWNTQRAGRPADAFVNKEGYRQVTLMRRNLLAHRLIWMMVYGEWPITIDHINGDGTDNRLGNMRNVDCLENSRNRPVQKNNSSGVLGVSWSKSSEKWIAAIKANGKTINLGAFDDLSEAAAARAEANRLYGFHQNHGRIRAGKEGEPS